MELSPSMFATILLVISSLTECLSGLCAQALQDVIPPFQLNCYRYVVQLLLSVLVVCHQRKSFTVQREHVYYLIATIVTSTVSNTAYYTAASRLPLGLFVTLVTLVQVLFALFVQRFVQYQIIHMLKIPGCCVVLLGSAFMLQPNLTLEDSEVVETRKLVGIILVVIAGVFGILTALVIQNSAPPEAIVVWSYWFSGGGAIASTILGVYTDHIQIVLTWHEVLFLLGHCLGAGITGILELIAYKHINLVTYAVFSNIKLVLNFILQYTVMYSVVKVAGNAIEILGVVVSMIGIIYTAGFDIYLEKTQII